METSSRTNQAMSEGGVVGLEDDPGYRTLNVLALLSLGIGLAAPLCFAAPLLLVIPVLGMATAAVALRQIAASDGAMAGRWAALVGLALCVASVGAMFSRSFVKEHLISRQAREVGMEWLAHLQSGDAEAAFNMTSDSVRPSPPARPDAPPEEPAPDPVVEFRKRPIIDYLLTHGAHSAFRFQGDADQGYGTPSQYFVQQRYEVSDDEHGGEPIDLLLTLQRTRSAGQDQWMVANYSSDQLDTTADDDGHSHTHSHPHSH